MMHDVMMEFSYTCWGKLVLGDWVNKYRNGFQGGEVGLSTSTNPGKEFVAKSG